MSSENELDVFRLSLSEIEQIANRSLKETYYQLYQMHLLELITNRIDARIVKKHMGLPLQNLHEIVERFYLNNQSTYLFPGDIVLVYPMIHEYHSKKDIICDVSGALIRKGSLYCHYKPLLENLSTGEIYVLKTPLKSEVGEIDFFPTDIQGLDTLERNLNYPDCVEEPQWNYDDISKRVGGHLALRKLRSHS